MPAAGRLGDHAHLPDDTHGCPSCPHAVSGPAMVGSPDVEINNRPALRMGDPGAHGDCCGDNTWIAAGGAVTILINGRPALRAGDPTQHCGGEGRLASGSADVDLGDADAHLASPFALASPEPTPVGAGSDAPAGTAIL